MDEWTIPKASDAIRISLVPPAAFPSASKPQTFHPPLTYQLFENETIYGYKNLAVDLKFRQDDMSPSLAVAYDARLPTDGPSNDSKGDAKVDDVEPLLREYLPADTPSDLDLSESTFTPPGLCVNTYTRKGSKFQIYHSNVDDPIALDIVRRSQILVLFFIEAGSVIDLDEDWVKNRWDVFFLYETLPDNKSALVGFCTVHKYWYFSPAEKTTEGEPAGAEGTDEDRSSSFLGTITEGARFPREHRARISQFLVLPPYQKQGHAKELYNTIVEQYLAGSEVKEITVEDPSERFEELRDVADYTRLKKASLVSTAVAQNLLESRTAAKPWIETQRQLAKMPRRQFMRMVELLLLEHIFMTKSPEIDEQLEKYAMYVKERLYRHNKDILMQLEREERGEKLHETYVNVFEGYLTLLKKLQPDALVGLATSSAVDKRIISGKRPQGNISSIAETGEEDEDEEELEPPSKKKRLGPKA
ncbi:hypothetical protein DRE_03763 [Drechslerella stenobrocha 248]|uniref:Histone acetyltransferase type B catalytic subunit n=1 Tax=Drechslerella stenobrocha 248 TaxID=1043628 RepID=W7HSK7_9PEZI|nr:hypothetical protein DRE_03763 [Drechslerella stenobrocha 248]